MVRKSNSKLKEMKPLSVGVKKLNRKSVRVRNPSTYKIRDGTERDRNPYLRIGRNVHAIFDTFVPSSG